MEKNADLVAGVVVGELKEFGNGPRGGVQKRRGFPDGRGGARARRLRGVRDLPGVFARRAARGHADSRRQIPLVVAGERAGDVDPLVAVAAEERPVFHAENERRLLLPNQK